METFAIFYMIASIIWLAFIYFRLREIDDNATANTNHIRRDIVDHDSHIRTAVSDCALQVSDMEKNLTTEIACLATKNNEDIKRMKDGWQEGDVIESNGKLYFVLEPVYDPNDGGNPCGYRLIDQDRACSYRAKELVENATLVKHTSGLSDIFDE